MDLETRLKKIEEDIEEIKEAIDGIYKRLGLLEDKPEGMKREELTSAERQILEDLRNEGWEEFTIHDIAERYGITYAGAYKHVTSLVKKGYLERVEPNPGEGRLIRYKLKV